MNKEVEILVIGAGPAGLSAAIEAAKYGAEVLVVDENNKPGGQLFKQIHKFFGSRRHKAGVRGVDIGTELLEEEENDDHRNRSYNRDRVDQRPVIGQLT